MFQKKPISVVLDGFKYSLSVGRDSLPISAKIPERGMLQNNFIMYV